MIRVAILGSTGMLGSTITRVLEKNIATVYEFNRPGVSVTKKNQARKFDVIKSHDFSEIFNGLRLDYIINCIGKIKQLIDSSDEGSVKLAYEVNSEFPLKLDKYAASLGIPVIQIATDCVYSGNYGLYSENDPHDPIDLYGMTKNKGELSATSSMQIRCSIIGKELNTSNSLLSWVISQPNNSKINGFTNHFWNGVTTFHFSQIISGVIKNDSYKRGLFHLVPSDIVSKYELIKLIARSFDRPDLIISKFEAETTINRSLITINPQFNLSLWENGGYNIVPTIKEMVSTYSTWTKLE